MRLLCLAFVLGVGLLCAAAVSKPTGKSAVNSDIPLQPIYKLYITYARVLARSIYTIHAFGTRESFIYIFHISRRLCCCYSLLYLLFFCLVLVHAHYFWCAIFLSLRLARSRSLDLFCHQPFYCDKTHAHKQCSVPGYNVHETQAVLQVYVSAISYHIFSFFPLSLSSLSLYSILSLSLCLISTFKCPHIRQLNT